MERCERGRFRPGSPPGPNSVGTLRRAFVRTISIPSDALPTQTKTPIQPRIPTSTKNTSRKDRFRRLEQGLRARHSSQIGEAVPFRIAVAGAEFKKTLGTEGLIWVVESLYGNSEARIVLVGALGEESRERNRREESRGRIGGDRRIGGRRRISVEKRNGVAASGAVSW